MAASRSENHRGISTRISAQKAARIFTPGSFQLLGRSKLFLFTVTSTVICSSLVASATITVTRIQNASRCEGFTVNPGPCQVTNLPTGTTTAIAPTIYGGVAGTCTPPAGGGMCDTCNATGTGDGALLACNETAIYPGLQLIITFSSDTADGIPELLPTTTGGTATPTPITPVGAQQYVTKGTLATLTVNWSDICTNVTDIGGTAPANCAATGDASAQFQIGIASTAVTTGTPTTTPGTLTDSLQIAIHVVGSSGVMNGATSLSSSSGVGVSHFAVQPGDGEAEIVNLQAPQGFNQQSIPFRQIKVLYASGQDFTAITNGTPKPGTYLTINQDTSTTSTDTSFHVDPARVTGLTNDTIYAFKLAVVDFAGNVGLYTPSSEDQSCEAGDPATPLQANTCHLAQPGAVVGLLSKPINCFIATAAYGSPLAPQVEVFRRFRNLVLMKTVWGQRFIDFYYEHSPKYAKIIAGHPALRAVSRAALWPLLGYAKLALTIGPIPAVVTIILLFVMCALVFSSVLTLLRPGLFANSVLFTRAIREGRRRG